MRSVADVFYSVIVSFFEKAKVKNIIVSAVENQFLGFITPVAYLSTWILLLKQIFHQEITAIPDFQIKLSSQSIFKTRCIMSMRPDDHRRKWDKKEYERKVIESF